MIHVFREEQNSNTCYFDSNVEKMSFTEEDSLMLEHIRTIGYIKEHAHVFVCFIRNKIIEWVTLDDSNIKKMIF